jgi:Uma2 family endonuclease
MNMLAGTALGPLSDKYYGHQVFGRDGFVCVYCGFDGNGFNNWRQLSVNHLRPAGSGGTDSRDNLVTACYFCNSATSRMTFSADKSADEILKLKRDHIAKRLKPFYKFWSQEVAPKLAGLTPSQGDAYLPHPLALRFQAIYMTEDQFLQFCADNGDLRFELTANKELIVMPPAGLETGWREGKFYLRLGNWAEWDGTGLALGSSAGFTLANGAIRAPDASWLLRSKWDALPKDERKKFGHICPDFVLELRSPSDPLQEVQDKMAEYMENGVRLGWLIDPRQRRVYVYRPGEPVELLEDPATMSGEPVLPGFELSLQEIW